MLPANRRRRSREICKRLSEGPGPPPEPDSRPRAGPDPGRDRGAIARTESRAGAARSRRGHLGIALIGALFGDAPPARLNLLGPHEALSFDKRWVSRLKILAFLVE